MLDEEGYMALNRQLKAGSSTHGHQKTTRPDASTGSCNYKVLLWILGSGFIITGLATIILSIFVFLGAFHRQEASEGLNSTTLGSPKHLCECCSHSQQIGRLKDLLCRDPTESSECKLCPVGWIAQKGRCYWFSRRTSQWLEAQGHCSRRGARLLAIKDSEELDFVQKNMKGEYRFWTGLRPMQKTRTRVDGPSLDHSLPPPPLAKDRNNCNVIHRGQVRSEMCTDEFKWICEMEGFLI